MIEVPFPTFPHLPETGDEDKRDTHAAIGEFIDEWESVEFDLSRTFAAAMGHPDGRIIPFYGEKGRIFRDRVALLNIAVEHHFVVNPHQELEARYDKMIEAVTWYAARRNEAAHTIVYDLADFGAPRTPPGRPHYFAVPPLYAFTRREREPGQSPPYALSSNELGKLSHGAFRLLAEARNVRHSMFPNEWPQEQRVPSL